MNFNKRLSIRELIMLGALVVIAAYYFLVQGPVKKEMEELETEKTSIQAELDVNTSKLTKKKSMEKELDEIFAANGDAATMVPEYNNLNPIISELNAILDTTVTYQVNFSDPVEDGDIVRRDIRVQYTTPSYAEAVQVLRYIHDSHNHYLIRNLSIASNAGRGEHILWEFALNPQVYDKDGKFSVDVGITSFEYINKKK